MHIAEIAIEGLDGAADFAKVEIAPGLTVLPATPKEALFRRVLLDLLYPKDGDSSLKALALPDHPARVGTTVITGDGVEYRLLLEVGSGRRVLQRLAGDAAEVLSTAPGEIASIVRSALGFPSEELFRNVFICSPDELPSIIGGGKTTGTAAASADDAGEVSQPFKPAPLAPGFNPAELSQPFKPAPGPAAAAAEISQPNRPAPSPPGFGASAVSGRRGGPPGFNDAGSKRAGPRTAEQIRARLAELEAMVARDTTARTLEFELDGVQKQIFEVERRLAPLAALRTEVKRALEKFRTFDEVSSVPREVIDLVNDLPNVRAEHKKDLTRLGLERRRVFDSFGPLAPDGVVPRPFGIVVEDQNVRRGMGLGLGAIALAVAGSFVSPDVRWVALVDIPAFAFALFHSIRLLSEVERLESVERRLKRLDDEERGAVDRHELQEKKVKKLLEQNNLSAEDIPEVSRRLVQRVDAEEALNKARVAFEKLQQDPAVREAGREQGELQERLKSLEEELSAAAAGLPSMTDIRNERAELEAELEAAVAREAASGGSGEASAAPAGPALLVRRASEATSTPHDELAAVLRPRCAQLLQSLSGGHLRDVKIVATGAVLVADERVGARVQFSALAPEDKDAVWIAVKVAVIEHLLKQGRVPVIVDGGFDLLSDVRGSLARKLLQFLGTVTQVISVSTRPALGGRTS